MVGLCESWLLPEIPSSSIAVAGYKVFRNDTDSGQRKHGVCVYISDDLALGRIYTDHPNTVGVTLPSYGIFVLVVYRPPSNTLVMDQELIDYIISSCAHGSVCLMGDFNLPTVNWDLDPPSASSFRDQAFLNCFAELGLKQHILETTFVPSGRILDLVLMAEGEHITAVSTLPPLPGCGHAPVEFSLAVPMDEPRERTELPLTRDWFRGNYSALSEFLREIDWVTELSGRSADSAYDYFLQRIFGVIDDFVPVRGALARRSSPGNKNLPNSLRLQKTDTWLRYKAARLEHGRVSPQALVCWHEFSRANDDIKRFKRDARCEYELQLLDNLINRPKCFHSYLRSRKVDKPGIGPILVDGDLTDDPMSMAECFVRSFAGVLDGAVVPLHPQAHQLSDSALVNVPFVVSTVESALNALDPSGSVGPDGLHPVMLKRCSGALSLPLYLLFTKSLNSMSIPNVWRTSNIVPIYKKGSHSDPLNYRPISLTSVCSKTFERILADSIRQYLEDSNILSEAQYGFRPGRSVQDQLILTYEYVTQEYDAGRMVELVLFDFRKAFDLVPHGVLLNKLGDLGFGDPLLGWLGDFLSERSMRVVVSGSTSTSRPVRSGVPQGSVLGPLLFIIFINHLTHDLNSKAQLFADDLKLYLGISRCSSTYIDGMRILQTDIDTLFIRAASWGLEFASDKCIRMNFVRLFADAPLPGPLNVGGFQLPLQSVARDLGVDIDTSLRFHRHISSVVCRALGVSGNILRGTVCRTPEFMKRIFVAHIRPLLDYCSPVWNTGFIADVKSLEAVQRRWTKNIDGFSNLPYYERLRLLDLFSIRGRLLRADLILAWRITHGLTPPLVTDILPLVGAGRTRGHRFKLVVHRSETEARGRFFTRRIVSVWNDLPPLVVESTSLNMFKARLHEALGDLLYQYHE